MTQELTRVKNLLISVLKLIYSFPIDRNTLINYYAHIDHNRKIIKEILKSKGQFLRSINISKN